MNRRSSCLLALLVLAACPAPPTDGNHPAPTYADAPLRLRLTTLFNDAGVDLADRFAPGNRDVFLRLQVMTEWDGGQRYIDPGFDVPGLYLPDGLVGRVEVQAADSVTPLVDLVNRPLTLTGMPFRYEILRERSFELEDVKRLTFLKRGLLAPGDKVVGDGTLTFETPTGFDVGRGTAIFEVVDPATASLELIDDGPVFPGGQTLSLENRTLRLSEPVQVTSKAQVGFAPMAPADVSFGFRELDNAPWNYGPLFNFNLWGSNALDGPARWPLVQRTVHVPAGVRWGGAAFSPFDRVLTPAAPETRTTLDFATTTDTVAPRLFLSGHASIEADPSCERGTCLVMTTSATDCRARAFALFTLAPVTDRQNRTFRMRVLGNEPAAREHLLVTQYQGNSLLGRFWVDGALPAGTVAGFAYDSDWQEYGFDNAVGANDVPMTIRLEVTGCTPGTKVLLQQTGIYTVP